MVGAPDRNTKKVVGSVICVEKNGADAIRELHKADFDFSQDSGVVLYGPDGTKTTTFSSIYIAAENTSADAIRELHNAGVDFSEDAGVV